MKRVVILFSLILAVMILVTVWASSYESVWVGGAKVLDEPWGVATLFDAYCGFFTFYAWVFYKERNLVPRVLWLLAILGLGNMAMAAYVLLQVRMLRAGEGAEALLLRRERA